LLPFHPQPLENEILSSWMVRLAFANGYKLHTFYSGLIGYKDPIWNRDIDRNPSEELIKLLHYHTGQPVLSLRSMALKSFESHLFASHPIGGHGEWILPLGIFHRLHRRRGMQYCPLCLQSDLIPYFRKIWRLSFYVVCPLHECVMEEQCPSCMAPITYHRHGVGRERKIIEHALSYCSHCSFDLRQTIPDRFSWGDEPSRSKLFEIINVCHGGLWNCGTLTPPCSIPFFRGLHILCSLINGRHGQRILQKLSVATDFPVEFVGTKAHSRFNFIGIRDRLHLQMMVSWLLVDWPNRFVELCRYGRLTRSRISDEVDSLPFWLANVVNEFLDGRLYSFSESEIAQAMNHLKKMGSEMTPLALAKLLGIGLDGANSLWKSWDAGQRKYSS
jgi:hypothetical protein